MKTLRLVLITLAMIPFIAGCKKDNRKIDNGTYTGTFKVIYSSGTQTGTVTVELKRYSKFFSTGNPDFIPAGGSGDYSINGDKINFKDKNRWQADFDWNLILNEEYYYSFDGNHLKMWADKNNMGYYEYDLYKQ